MEPIQNIVFDMGKVLMDFDADRVCAYYIPDNKTLKDKVRRAVFGSTEWMALDMGIIEEETALSRIQANMLDTAEERNLAALCLRDWHLYNIWPKHGMDVLVREVQDAGFHTYVLSNASKRVRPCVSSRIPGADRMSGMLFSAEDCCYKPQPEIYRLFFERFSLNPKNCFFIDDLPENIAGAKRMGMNGYCFADGDVEGLRSVLKQIIG